MADIFTLTGGFFTRPASGSPSGFPSVEAPISEVFSIDKKVTPSIDLDTDSPVACDLGNLTDVNVLIVKAIGGKVRMRITSADGATQSIPIDSFFVLTSLSVPITALDFTRQAGVLTTVQTFLGQRA